MKKFNISVSNCGNCPYGAPEDEAYNGHCSYLYEGCFDAYEQNKDGLTPSCPMWPQSIEVSE